MRSKVRMYMPMVRKNLGSTLHTRGMKGKGAGTLLLDGGKGSGSSYVSLDDYVMTTNNSPKSVGMGLESLGKKLDSLAIKNRKPKNIKFSF